MPGPPRVAYYLQRFPHLTETFILREMIFLQDMGVDVQIFSMLPPAKAPIMHQEVQRMIPCVHYNPHLFSLSFIPAHFHFLLHSPLKYVRALGRLIWQTGPNPTDLCKALTIFPESVYFARQIEEMEVDHIHAHFIWLNAIAAQVAADLTGVTYSLHAHAWDIFQRNRECVRRQIELATSVVTVSEFHRHYLANLCPRWSPEEIHLVHYGIDPTEFCPAPVPTTDATFRILSVGSLFEKKGHTCLIAACAELVARGYRIDCSIVGAGRLKEALEIQIHARNLSDCVHLLGARNQQEVQALYRHSDVFVLACVTARNGDRDGMPNVLLEAMALQLPVITTPITGNPELVHDGENGLLVPEKDAHALALAIERLINDPGLRLHLGEKGRQTIVESFDIHQTAAQMFTLFSRYKK
jgi:colanic acid/amylovoran biosynthesis glycosyltransferase